MQGHRKSAEEEQEEDLWPCRTFKAREWGHALQLNDGSHEVGVKKLIRTLKDGRTLTEQPLRLTALQALTPAALVGHRGALAAQAAAVLDRSKAVRECALDALWDAAGQQRPEEGGAVHATLSAVLPPPDARYKAESRRATADAVRRLAPRGDQALLSVVRGWLEDEDADVRAAASQATGLLSNSVDDVRLLAPLLKDKNWRVAAASIDALEQISGGDGLRHRCKPKKGSKEPSSRRVSGASRSSSKRGVMSMSKSTPALAVPVSEDGSRPSTANNLQIPTPTESGDGSPGGRRRLSGARAGGRNSTRRSSTADPILPEPEDDWDPPDPDGMPRPSATMLAASRALAEPCEEGLCLRGLPRADAVGALRRVAPWGDVGALKGVAARLRDTDHEVRREAVAAVIDLAPGDKSQALQFCTDGLEELDWRARAAAVDAMVAVAKPQGDEEAMRLAASMLAGPEWGQRRGAAAALTSLVAPREGDEHRDVMRKLDLALEAISPHLHNPHWSVRRKALVAVSSVCEVAGGHKKSLRRVKDMANDKDEQVRLALAAGLPRIAPVRSKEAVMVALELASNDVDEEVRVMALQAVAELCTEGRSRTRKAIRQTARLFADDSEQVRQQASQVISTIGFNRRTAIDSLTDMMKSSDDQARILAAETFQSVIGDRQDRGEKRTLRLMRHNSDTGVREAASLAMALSSTGPASTSANQDPQVVLAASAMAMKWRRNRFSGVRGNMLSPEERLANYAARGEDPSKDEEWEELFGPNSRMGKKAPPGAKRGMKKPKKKRKGSKNSSSVASRAGEESSQASVTSGSGGEESDDGASVTSKQSDASRSSRMSKSSKSTNQSSVVSSKYKGKSNAQIRRMQEEEEKERREQNKEKYQRYKELAAIMESSDEEELSESGTEEDSDEEDLLASLLRDAA